MAAEVVVQGAVDLATSTHWPDLLVLFHLLSNSFSALYVGWIDILDSVVDWRSMCPAARVGLLDPCSNSPALFVTSHGSQSFQQDIPRRTASDLHIDRKIVPLVTSLFCNSHKTSLYWTASPSRWQSTGGTERPSSDVHAMSWRQLVTGLDQGRSIHGDGGATPFWLGHAADAVICVETGMPLPLTKKTPKKMAMKKVHQNVIHNDEAPASRGRSPRWCCYCSRARADPNHVAASC